jgi:hypothetical protein
MVAVLQNEAKFFNHFKVNASDHAPIPCSAQFDSLLSSCSPQTNSLFSPMGISWRKCPDFLADFTADGARRESLLRSFPCIFPCSQRNL